MQTAVVEKRIEIRWLECQRFFQIFICGIKVARGGFDGGSQAQHFGSRGVGHLDLVDLGGGGIELLGCGGVLQTNVSLI